MDRHEQTLRMESVAILAALISRLEELPTEGTVKAYSASAIDAAKLFNEVWEQRKKSDKIKAEAGITS